MENASVRLRSYMRRKRLSQQRLAGLTGVSQATVSRAINGLPLRRSAARSRLFSYAGIPDPELSGSIGKRRVLDALNRIWDGSEQQATALAKVIDALADFKAASNGKGVVQ